MPAVGDEFAEANTEWPLAPRVDMKERHMVRIDVVYEGELHTSARHTPSDGQLETDAPVDNQGRGESFSPTDLLATALGSCMLTVMGIVARRNGLDIAGARVQVEKHMVAEPTRRVGKLVVRLEMPAGIPLASRPELEQAGETCPVRSSLHPEVQVETMYIWAN